MWNVSFSFNLLSFSFKPGSPANGIFHPTLHMKMAQIPRPIHAIALLLVGTVLLHADYIPLEDFDSLPIGESLAGKDGWAVRTEGDSSALIGEDPEGKTGHVLELKGSPDPSQPLMLAKGGIAIRNPPYPSVGTIFFRFRLARENVSEEIKLGVSHADPVQAVAAGAISIKQYVWVRGGGKGEKPNLCNSDGSAIDPTVSFQPETWYEAWLVVSNNSKEDTKLFVRSADDPAFSELREITGQFLETPVPVPLVSFVLIKVGQRTVFLDRIAYSPDAATPGELPQ